MPWLWLVDAVDGMRVVDVKGHSRAGRDYGLVSVMLTASPRRSGRMSVECR